jgi:hypothetical protein
MIGEGRENQKAKSEIGVGAKPEAGNFPYYIYHSPLPQNNHL